MADVVVMIIFLTKLAKIVLATAENVSGYGIDATMPRDDSTMGSHITGASEHITYQKRLMRPWLQGKLVAALFAVSSGVWL